MEKLSWSRGINYTPIHPGRAVASTTRRFVGKYFVVRFSTTKTTKILPLENYPLYGINRSSQDGCVRKWDIRKPLPATSVKGMQYIYHVSVQYITSLMCTCIIIRGNSHVQHTTEHRAYSKERLACRKCIMYNKTIMLND